MFSNTDFAAIAALDLESIKAKLMQPDDGNAWTREQVDAVEFEYRRFLRLMKIFPHEHTAPRVDVDRFWHCHILHTKKYAADCETVFGYFLHHFPHTDSRGKDDEAQLARMGERTRVLYEQTFGDSNDRPVAGRGAGPNSAYCTRVDANPAYCTRADVQPAYCTRAEAQAAYCTRAEARPAYCTRIDGQVARSADERAPAAAMIGLVPADRPAHASA